MADIIMTSPIPVDIITIGPMTNYPRLLKMYPNVVKNARIRAMAGSVYKGFDNSSIPVPEYNVETCASCSNKTINAEWMSFSLTPVDTSGLIQFNTSQIKQLLSTLNPLGLGAVNCMAYSCLMPQVDACSWSLNNTFTHIFDPVAVLLTLPSLVDEWLVTKVLNIFVTSNGSTIVKEDGAPICVAVDWKPHGLASFVQFIADSLCREVDHY